ncbi:MAG: hypothetical protein K5981_05290 [Clostridia bacterium]|nr:hypothetical protein [Clostridia bacterium]
MKEKGKKTAGAAAIIVFLGICAALYVYIYVVPQVTGALTPTAIAQYGEMLTSNPADCIVFRSEKVALAEQSGQAGYYAGEGDKTRLGEKIADVYPAGGAAKSYYMETTGVVSYWYDGFEDVFRPDALDVFTPDVFDDPSAAFGEEETEQADWPEPRSVNTAEKEKDDPLYKIVLGDMWYMALRIDSAYMDRYAMGAKISVDPGSGAVDARVIRMTQYEDCWVVIAQTNRYYSSSCRLRRCSATIVTEDNTGLIIPTSARCFRMSEEGEMQEGVYVKNIRDEYHFCRISVLAEDTEKDLSLVAEDTFFERNGDGETVTVYTLSVYDEILRDGSELSDVRITDEVPEEEEEEIVFEWEKPAPEEGEE